MYQAVPRDKHYVTLARSSLDTSPVYMGHSRDLSLGITSSVQSCFRSHAGY